jgi:pimeloyl-ACP methyl ester carboxylesterase
MHTQVNGSQLAVIEKSGHFSNLENKDDFNKALAAFCRSVFR